MLVFVPTRPGAALRRGDGHARARPEPGPQGRAAQHDRRLAQFLALVRRHHGHADPRGAFRHGRRPDRLGEDALIERELDHARGRLGVADDDRDDVGRGAAHVEALAGQAVAQRLRVRAELRHAAGLLLQQVQRGHGGRGGDRRQRRGVQQRPGGVHEEPRGHVVAGHEAAVGAEGLGERAGDDVDLALEAGLGDGAAAVGAEGAERVGLVDQHADVVAVAQVDDLAQRRDVAVHAEHAVGGDQGRAAVALAQGPGQVVGVGVAVGHHLGAR